MDERGTPIGVSIERDSQGIVRQLTHFQQPFTDRAIDPDLPPLERAQRLVVSYLKRFGALFGLGEEQIAALNAEIGAASASRKRIRSRAPAPAAKTGIEFRWGESRSIRKDESVLWSIQQTQLVPSIDKDRPFDVWQGGLRIVVHMKSFAITSSVSTALLDLDPRLGNPAEAGALGGLGPEPFAEKNVLALLSRLLGIAPAALREAVVGGAIYRVRPRDMRDASAPVDDRPVATVRYNAGPSAGATVGHRVFVDPIREEIVYSRVLAAGQATGSVFGVDPRTSGGPAAPGTDEYGAKLDLVRNNGVALPGLTAPPPTLNQALVGEFVAIMDPDGNPGGPAQPPPAPFNFDYRARTDDFAAVNAYYHCDALFRLVEALGFPRAQYFAQGQFPLSVLPRASILDTPCVNGLCLNAQVVQDGPASNTIRQIRFALADLSDCQNPLGMATDRRTVWHEFCHVLLIAGTGDPQFGFAHSAGDALAAIACDPQSSLADVPGDWRGVTFPWVWQSLRRHDREARDGWGWYGELYDPSAYPEMADLAGYRAEQILSSTLFRLYRAAGGDARTAAQGPPDVAHRQAAADYIVYLIVRAILHLGPASTTPSWGPSVFATALIDADFATPLFTYNGANRPGGTLKKAIRWAFIQQGCYYPPSTLYPQNGAGPPEPVDLYIDDGRQGGYDFVDDWQALPNTLWLRNAADGGLADQPPTQGQMSYVYVRVSNLGTQAAPGTHVDVFAASGGALATWDPTVWTRLNPAPSAAILVTVPASGWVVLGPYEWTPATPGAVGLLAAASAPADLPNTDQTTPLPCATGPTALSDLVPLDNNLGYRSWTLP